MPLTFVNEGDYNLLDACDEVSTEGLLDVLRSGGQGQVRLRVKKRDGTEVVVDTKHTLSVDQCGFIMAGSALNLLALKASEAREEVTRQAELSD